ncbi:MAG: hypothetical protein IPN13_17425 [Bacteroidetes bacterium]|nr:hypothetical protein [Bacteroidota bacterium]
MPELFIENIDNIFILGSANSHLSIPFVISQNELPKDPFAYDDDIYLTLGNIGVAPAKNIRIGWNCDYSKIYP